MSAPLLLDRLRGVRKNGNGWRADCPNGHGKARGSLSISEGDDGRVMLHCFACSDTPGILRGVGLELADLYPERAKDPSPEARSKAAEAARLNGWRAALGVLATEATVVQIAADDIHGGKVLAANDVARVGVAAQRIAQAKEVLCEHH